MNQRIKGKLRQPLHNSIAIRSTEIFQIKIFNFNFNKTKDRVEISSINRKYKCMHIDRRRTNEFMHTRAFCCNQGKINSIILVDF
jgi:hypothetical protein